MPITINDIFKSMDGSLNNPKLEEFFNKTKEAAETVGQMSAERLELGRKKVECLDAKAKLSKMYERFGKLQYSLYVGENVDDNEIAEVADNIAVLKNRIEEFGVKGFISHTVKKAVWMWEDGTYFISHHLEKTDNWNPLHSLVLDKGSYHNVFYIYSCGFQLFLIFMMILSVFKGCIKPKVDKTILLKGLLFSILIFLLIWESRSRYLYNFTPVFILLAVDGLQELENFIRNKVKSRLQ